jgi:hypothetical protein
MIINARTYMEENLFLDIVDVRMEECTGARQRMRRAWHVAETPRWTWQVRACCYSLLSHANQGATFNRPFLWPLAKWMFKIIIWSVKGWGGGLLVNFGRKIQQVLILYSRVKTFLRLFADEKISICHRKPLGLLLPYWRALFNLSDIKGPLSHERLSRK